MSLVDRESSRGRPCVPSRGAGVLSCLLLAMVLAGSLGSEVGAEPPPVTEWVARYTGTGNGNNQVTAMTQDERGDLFVTGYSSGTFWDIATVKYTPQGEQVWASRFNGDGGGDDVPAALALDRRGNLFVVGYSDGTGNYNYDFLTIKYDSTGTQQWARLYHGEGNPGLDEATAVAVDSAGYAYVTGFSYGPGTGSDWVTIKYSPSGQRLWVQRYDAFQSNDGANAIALDDAGNVYVTGLSSPFVGNMDLTTIRYDADGQPQWIRRLDRAGGNDSGLDIALDHDGGVYVGGFSTGDAGSDMILVKYSSNGTPLWTLYQDGPAHGADAAQQIALDPEGTTACAVGFVSVAGQGADFATLKADSAGNPLWTATYDGPVHGFDEGQALAIDGAGNIYVTGYSDGGTDLVNYDYATIKYDPAGEEQWTLRYNGPGDNIDVAVGIAVDAGASVYVSGWSTGTRGTYVDFTTIRYDQTGTVAVDAGTHIAPVLSVDAVWPNPFTDAVNLRYALRKDGPVELGLWTVSGRHVATLRNGWEAGGVHEVRVDASGLPAGVYLYRLRSGRETAGGKLVRR